ncbi:carbamoyltransferase family protein [Brevibacillus dissolubilis]|uniref:carbamoyltransferase family protein n=1 Tax=Brevibacillus dissolubilis TaxID=1844116 RepID=UPI001116EF56|nr:carbamoyltransferase [Brevibacillus dissolubilis]
MGLNIIGISALYHDSACCLLQDGVLVAAAEEERFTRIKHDPSMPVHALRYCLETAGLSITDIDCIAYYEFPETKLARQLWSGYDIEQPDLKKRLDPTRPEREIRELLGYHGRIEYVGHHLSHAASSFYFSGFQESAIMTVDGVGEWATTTYGYGKDHEVTMLEQVNFPDSIGLLYSAITSYLGFKVNSGEYKVMGLAPYGKPIYAEQLRQLITLKEKGQYELDLSYFDFISGNKMYSDKLIELLGQPPRKPETEISQFYKDISRSLQLVLEEILLEKVNYLYEVTKSDNLCLAGGVALNCVANGKIKEQGPFKNLFVQPAANDAGCALGAAAVAHTRLSGQSIGQKQMEHVYLGAEYSNSEIRRVLEATSLNYEDYDGDNDKLIERTASLIAHGKVIGWFQGRMEFGPRALGARSILADPRDPKMRDLINAMVKKREGFRPFAPAVLEEKMLEHFALDAPSPFMLRTCQVVSPLDLPAITHVDGSARVQTVSDKTHPLFTALIREFDKQTGCPIVLNTSFNVRGEPIVMTPYDAIACFITTQIDCLVLGNFVIERSKNSLAMLKVIVNNLNEIEKSYAVSDSLYTFI